MLIPLDANNSTDGFHIDTATGHMGLYRRGVRVGISQRVPFYVGKTSGFDTDGRNGGLAGCEQVLDVTLTEAAAAYALVWDNSAAAFQQLSAAGSGDFVQYQLFPNNKQDTDILYLGHSQKWCQAFIDMSATVQTYTGNALVWEYWNGVAWTALTGFFDFTDATAQNGVRSFGRDGSLHFTPPSSWAAVAINGTTGYWIRARAGTAANIGTIGITASKRHQLCSPANGYVVPASGIITGVAIRNGAATVHSAADIKFLIVNFTTGETTAEITFLKSKRNDRTTALTLAVTTGDVLGILIRVEDGTNELGPATFELDLQLSFAS